VSIGVIGMGDITGFTGVGAGGMISGLCSTFGEIGITGGCSAAFGSIVGSGVSSNGFSGDGVSVLISGLGTGTGRGRVGAGV